MGSRAIGDSIKMTAWATKVAKQKMERIVNSHLPIKMLLIQIALWIQLIPMRHGAQSRLILMEFMLMALEIMDSAQMTVIDARLTIQGYLQMITWFAKNAYAMKLAL